MMCITQPPNPSPCSALHDAFRDLNNSLARPPHASRISSSNQDTAPTPLHLI